MLIECAKMSEEKRKRKGYFKKYLFYDIHKVLCLGLWELYYRPKKILISKDAKKYIKGGALVCLNHQSPADVPCIQVISPFRRNHIIAGEIAFRSKVGSFFLKLLLAIPINRDAFSYGQFRDIVNLLKDDRLVNIFCEGHMNYVPHTIDEVKEGPILMALTAKVPLIPVYILPKQSKFERLRLGYGEPIYLDKLGFGKHDLKEASIYLHDRLVELMNLVEDDYKKTRSYRRRKKDN